MKKHWWIALVLVLALAVPVMASQALKIYINNQELKTDVPAQIIDGRTMVPLRAIAEYFGKTVNYDHETKTVTIDGPTELDKAAAISAEWLKTAHASTGETFATESIRNGCQPCHSGTGLERALTDNPYLPEAEGADKPRPIDCAACHTGVAQEAIETGVAKAALVPFASEDLKFPGSALCLYCHNSRRNTADLYEKWASGESRPVDYPHHDAGAIFTGLGGMEYPGVDYPSTTAHQSVGCTGCHMPKTEEGYASHKFNMDPAYIDQTCGKCHQGITEYTLGGKLQAEVDALLAELKELALAKVPGAADIGLSRTTFPFVDENGERLNTELVPLEAYVAAYNYYLVSDDQSGYVHNPRYIKALLQESINRLK